MGIKGQSMLNYMHELRAETKGYVISIDKCTFQELINDGISNIVYDILVRKEGIEEKQAINIAVKNYRPSFEIVVCETTDKCIIPITIAIIGLKITDEELNNKVIDYLKEYHKEDDIESNTLLRFVIDYKNKEYECPFYFAGDIRWFTGMYDTYMLNLMDYSKV